MYETDETERLAESEEFLERIQSDAVLGATDVEETIRRAEPDAEDVQIARLPAVAMRSDGARLFELSARRLGAGGVGEVRLATQPALRRDVAIKLARADAGQMMDRPDRLLLREALVMGYLEHPNIVPIHVLGRDEGGELVVAMKLIEGKTLEQIMRDNLHPLDDLLGVLISVCKALTFAHDRGIVHLDLKPANVMVDHYGDTYLVDWGSAVAFRDDVPETIPRPDDDGMVRGTPAYLAPELALGESPTVASDVYLLGGLLHAVLTGKPPNYGASPVEALRFAFRGEPRTYPTQAPAGLVAIADRALSRDPAARYPSAREVQTALQEYRASWAARGVLESARSRAAELESRIAAGAAPEEINAVFGTARQLLREAAKLLDGPNPAARDEHALVTQMARWELSQGDPKAALRLLHELPEPDLTLVSEAEAASTEKQGELDELRRQLDPRVASRSKAVLFATIGAVIAAIHLLPSTLGLPTSPKAVLGGHLVYLVLLLAITVSMRDRLLGTVTNRQIVFLIWAMSVFGLLLRFVVLVGRLELGFAIGLDLALVALVSMFGAATIDRRVWAAPAWYVVGAGACFLWPQLGSELFGLAHFFALASLAVAVAASEVGSPRRS